MYRFVYTSPLGNVELRANDEALTAIHWPGQKHVREAAVDPGGPRAVFAEACRQLDGYFAGALRSFDLPLAASGTSFQRRVWQALVRIPFGETRSYFDVAAELGNTAAVRAVAAANARNPFSIVVPCHRVIGKDGALSGYAGGVHVKRWLLDHERRSVYGRSPQASATSSR
jgi:methylated-DNA-[protein]-cysteine S-methyltransferase